LLFCSFHVVFGTGSSRFLYIQILCTSLVLLFTAVTGADRVLLSRQLLHRLDVSVFITYGYVIFYGFCISISNLHQLVCSVSLYLFGAGILCSVYIHYLHRIGVSVLLLRYCFGAGFFCVSNFASNAFASIVTLHCFITYGCDLGSLDSLYIMNAYVHRLIDLHFMVVIFFAFVAIKFYVTIVVTFARHMLPI
jgi:hypothetical protein